MPRTSSPAARSRWRGAPAAGSGCRAARGQSGGAPPPGPTAGGHSDCGRRSSARLLRGDVAGGAAYQDRLAGRVTLDAALGRDPPGRAIRQHQPVFRLVSAAIRTRRSPSPSRLLRRSRSSGCSRFRMALNSSGSDGAKPNNSPPFLARPDLVSREVLDPDAKVGGIDGQAHARLALAQPGFAGLELVDELRRAEHVTADLVPHHGDEAQVQRAEGNRHREVCPIDQRGLNIFRAEERTRRCHRPSAPSGGRLAATP